MDLRKREREREAKLWPILSKAISLYIYSQLYNGELISRSLRRCISVFIVEQIPLRKRDTVLFFFFDEVILKSCDFFFTKFKSRVRWALYFCMFVNVMLRGLCQLFFMQMVVRFVWKRCVVPAEFNDFLQNGNLMRNIYFARRTLWQKPSLYGNPTKDMFKVENKKTKKLKVCTMPFTQSRMDRLGCNYT